MGPLTIAITYVATKFLDQFLKEQGYGRIKRLLFPKKKYKNELNDIIYNTIIEHQIKYPINRIVFDGTPFYHTPQVFDYFIKYILFDSKNVSIEDFLKEIEKVDNLIVPSNEEILVFFELFIYKIKHSKLLKDLYIEENYKTKIFELSDVLEKVKKIDVNVEEIKEKVNSIEAQLIFMPEDNWFVKQCSSAIIDLGNRYTPKLNFKLEVSTIFEGLGRTNAFKDIFTKQLDEFLIKGRKLIRKTDENRELINQLELSFSEVLNIYLSIELCSFQYILIQDIEKCIVEITAIVNKLEDLYENAEVTKKEQKEYSDKIKENYHYELSNVRNFYSQIYQFTDFLKSDIVNLANNPYLILIGEAGIGKSHMIGDIVTRRMEKNFESVFLLGQHFVSDENPWTQIFKKLQLNINSETFLSAINKRAKETGKRIIIFIDAVNEGRGKYFWNDNIKSFINEIKSYEYLGLVLTIRTSYKELIFPVSDLESFNSIFKTIYGFRNSEYEASKLFFDNYKIELPNVPLLHPEFQNPLFLKLFCEGINKAGLRRIPDGLQGITSIIDFFVENVNQKLSLPKHFNYSNTYNLVGKVIDSILRYKIDNKLRYISYESASGIVESTVSPFVSKKGFLDELISEGVFSKNLYWISKNNYEEGIYLAYERFEDHLICKYLLEKDDSIELRFKEGGDLYEYVLDRRAILRNRGLIDALSIQIPEKVDIELYECIPQLKNQYEIIESFVESLIWRKIETINERTKEYVNEFVFQHNGTYDLFWETTLSIAAIPGHLYNAYSLHNYLMQFSMADRDADWTQRLKYKYDNESAVKRLIDWAWSESDKTHICDESVKLSCIALAWFHTSTNRQLRDCATKALVCLLQDRINVLQEVLIMFETVNDPYVYERLFAVAYGCTVRTEQKDMLSELSEYIFQTIFNKNGEIYPHALLRDYARGVIEFTTLMITNKNIDLSKVRPPYNSNFKEQLPTDDEIEKMYEPKEEGHWGKEKWGITAILMSMGVEGGRRSYGDFGRYTFQSALDCWDISPSGLSNLAITWIIEKYGYDTSKHGDFDSEIGSGRGRNTIPNERIGKKYQWIALYEMIARIADNYPKYESWSYKKEKEEPYQGSWSPYIRDIDPTILIKGNKNYLEDNDSVNWWSPEIAFNWDCTYHEWIENTDDLPKFDKLIQLKEANASEWLILEGYPEWREPKIIGNENWEYSRKLAWAQIRSYLFKKEDFEQVKKWALLQDFTGRWMPESPQSYEIFSREYYWSPAYNYFYHVDDKDSEWGDIYENRHGKWIAKTLTTTNDFSWEEEFDQSKDEAIFFLKPCNNIFNGMNLKCCRKEGVFLNDKNEIICFDPKIYGNSRSCLLIKKEPFLNYLKENDLNILWTVIGEKQVIGGYNRLNRLEISGAYFLEDNQIKGEIKTKID